MVIRKQFLPILLHFQVVNYCDGISTRTKEIIDGGGECYNLVRDLHFRICSVRAWSAIL